MSDSASEPLPSHYTWLIPVDTRPSQCLHVCIKNKDKESSLHVVVSDFECLHGHRASHLMAEMVSTTDTNYHIDIEEPPECDVLKALQFIHADSPLLDLENCSALTYARTANFLDMRRLGEEIISSATAVIQSMTPSADEKLSDTSLDQSLPEVMSNRRVENLKKKFTVMNPWDAVAALTLLGDPRQALGLVNLKHWYKIDPRLFEQPNLFSSCHFFGPHKFAEIVRMINESNFMESIQKSTSNTQRILGYSNLTSSLQSDLIAVLDSYIGKRVMARRPKGNVRKSQSYLTGTVVNSFIEKDKKAYVVVEWHSSASKTVIPLRNFLGGDQFMIMESHSSRSVNRNPSPLNLKKKGLMKYT